ncbi:HXXEE domain-containing protein [Demequina salsinemoris]|uniref:HXXEE domain-containing protein n=1 Tax=Demequina salsinemoris TaxID=577470 RepID=UPI00078072AE|nr:HXXEE domain-containing protein [Demequina salsinemoris]
MALSGPSALFLAWSLHDLEEIAAFPAMSQRLADATGIDAVRMDRSQGALAVGLMGVLVGTACVRGARTEGRSRLYRAAVAGLEAHVWTHLAQSVAARGYTAGVATAVPVMLPGARRARHELEGAGRPLTRADRIGGTAFMWAAAVACQVTAGVVARAVRRRQEPEATR